MFKRFIPTFLPRRKAIDKLTKPNVVPRDDVDPNAINWLISNGYNLRKSNLGFVLFQLSKPMPWEFKTDLEERYPGRFQYFGPHLWGLNLAYLNIKGISDEEHMLLRLVGAIDPYYLLRIKAFISIGVLDAIRSNQEN